MSFEAGRAAAEERASSRGPGAGFSKTDRGLAVAARTGGAGAPRPNRSSDRLGRAGERPAEPPN